MVLLALLIVGLSSPAEALLWDLSTFFPNAARSRTYYMYNSSGNTAFSPQFFGEDYEFVDRIGSPPPPERWCNDELWLVTDTDIVFLADLFMDPSSGCTTVQSVTYYPDGLSYFPRMWDDTQGPKSSFSRTHWFTLDGSDNLLDWGTRTQTATVLGWENIPGFGNEQGIHVNVEATVYSLKTQATLGSEKKHYWLSEHVPVEGIYPRFDRGLRYGCDEDPSGQLVNCSSIDKWKRL